MAFLINHVVQGTLFPWTFLESPNFHWSITPQLGGFTGPRHALKIAASPDKHYARASFFLNLKKKRSYLPAKTAPKIARRLFSAMAKRMPSPAATAPPGGTSEGRQRGL